MDQPYHEEQIIFFLRKDLTLALVRADPGDRFSVENLHFVTVVDTDLTAFFDRIFDDAGRLVALQLMPVAADDLLVDAVSRLPYGSLRPGGKSMRIAIHEHSPQHSSRSDDQAFGGRVYRAENGEVAISINTEWLSEADLQSIRQAAAHVTSHQLDPAILTSLIHPH
jgi:hypothetical protein